MRKWSHNEFAQLLLASMVNQFIQMYPSEREDASNLFLEDKIDFITMICYYYNGLGTSELEFFVNSFLGKEPDSAYRAGQVRPQIQVRNILYDKPLLAHFKNDLKKMTILSEDYERLHLLLGVLEGEGFAIKASEKTLHDHVVRDLTRFSVFVKAHSRKTPVFIIDGIDENRHFFRNNQVDKSAFEAFCFSSIHQEILSIVMAHHFFLSIFYPKIDGITIGDTINRKDKFPIHSINWNSKSIANYADYVLKEMNQNEGVTRCKPFKDFKTLVNSSNKKIAEIIEKIPTPRALHFFMTALIREMNTNANSVSHCERLSCRSEDWVWIDSFIGKSGAYLYRA